MATFQIYQDAEKENPTIAAGKDKVKANFLGAGAIIAQKQGRSNLALLNANGNARITHAGGVNKAAFREVSNVGKAHDENVPTAQAAIKKSTVVPVVEQFKSFTVYEDKTDVVVQQSNQHVSATHTESVTNVVVNKENICIQQQQQRVLVDVKRSDTIHKDFVGITAADYGLDTTPMSVSDVLSPMSVDRSQLTHHTSTDFIGDGSDSKLIAESPSECERKLLPLNNRQRFFEVLDYQHDILEYFRESEKKHRPKSHYMRRQNDINYSMRTILVDWLVEVSEEYNLDTETLYLSVSYIDRFLSQMSVVRGKLQLVGTAAMYIASKYEEIYPPDVGEFVFITDDTYSKAQLLRMEQIILKILAFDLCTPTAYVFINTYAVLLSEMSDKMKFLTQYICELALLEADPYLRFHPSLISSASLALARHLLDVTVWSSELEDITSYHLEDLKDVLLHLCKSHNAAVTLSQQAIQEKYKAEKYKQVATIKPVELDDDLFDEIVRKYNESVAASSSNSNEQAMRKTSNENVRRMISLMFN